LFHLDRFTRISMLVLSFYGSCSEVPGDLFSLNVNIYTRQQKLEARVQYIVEELFDV